MNPRIPNLDNFDATFDYIRRRREGLDPEEIARRVRERELAETLEEIQNQDAELSRRIEASAARLKEWIEANKIDDLLEPARVRLLALDETIKTLEESRDETKEHLAELNEYLKEKTAKKRELKKDLDFLTRVLKTAPPKETQFTTFLKEAGDRGSRYAATGNYHKSGPSKGNKS